jgi:CRP/FNR family cyclic AMP-dependent transcriptional regulator
MPIDPLAALGASSGGDPAPAPGPLSHIPLFSKLDSQEQQGLFALMQRAEVRANDPIFWRGDRGESLYIVHEGRVAVSVPSEGGEHVSVGSIGPGELFGEISLLDGGPRTATCRAADDSVLYTLQRSDFQRFIRTHPDAALDILAVMGQRQRAATEALRYIKNPNIAFHAMRITLWQRFSDIVARVAASQWFTMFHVSWFGLWISLNLAATVGILPKSIGFDPFPFGLLTMVVSLEAIFLSIFVMVSQNRQSEKDRLRIDLDYQVNVKAQNEIQTMARRLEEIETLLRER